jgi:DNA replication protein DnaC
MTKPPKKKAIPAKRATTSPQTNLRERVLDDAKTLKLPLSAETLDAALARAEQEGLSHLHFLELIFGEPAARSRQRAIERRIRDAKFREDKNLADFDWLFNAPAIDRTQIEQLATGQFVRRGENLVMVGQSGVGKSFLLQALSKRFCELGYRVRYTTSAELLEDLRKSLAEQSLPRRVRYWSRFDLVVIDEFGFDRIERGECPQAADLFYKLIDARSGRRSTALATNIDFEAWSEYLGDPPLAMAFLDRVVDGAILLKIRGKSYRAHRAQKASSPPKPDTT